MADAAPVTVECGTCGAGLRLPDGLAEGAAFACGQCGQVARNVESTRRLRWSEVDPYVRRHGVSRFNLWSGLLGSVAWIPILAFVLLATGYFDIGLLLVVAAPYLAVLAVLKQRRARTPPALWLAHLWIGLGAYLVYLFTVVSVFPKWVGLILDVSGTNRSIISRWMLATMGAGAIVVGACLDRYYRSRARRVPRAVPQTGGAR
jgi:hypothetical protein